jgi:glyoxylase-like metal-dependent hydrolase (beta-lactamase superfamily II)
MNPQLRHEVFVTEQIPQSGRGPLPDGSTRMWSPITSTLIMGRRDAVLVDPPLTTAQAADVGDWIANSGRELRRIYITHGHGDHWFGAIPLLERFPGVTVLATAGTAKMMAAQNDPQFRSEFWDLVFPGQLPVGEVDTSIVDERGFDLEGAALVPVDVGHTDTDDTTMLHLPEIDLLVAGDVVYNGVHQYLTESGGAEGIDQWLRAFDNPSQIQHTRRYLTDARRLLSSLGSAQEFYDEMLRRHPGRINPGALWGAAITLFPTLP